MEAMEIINMIKNGQNPQQIVMSILEGNLKETPMGANLLELAKNKNTPEIEKIARNLYEQRGLDFDKEFSAFKQQFGL